MNRTVSLIGENRETAIIDANGTGTVLRIEEDHVNISKFNVRYSGLEGLPVDNLAPKF